jgi:hypothetical protein
MGGGFVGSEKQHYEENENPRYASGKIAFLHELYSS